jgi:AraC-like DNA-binding protein
VQRNKKVTRGKADCRRKSRTVVQNQFITNSCNNNPKNTTYALKCKSESMVINKTIFSDALGNELRLSSANQIEQPVKFNAFSAKYVVSGSERYTLPQKKMDVHEGEYVIGNHNTSSKVLIDNNTNVKGICMDVSKTLLTDVIAYKFKDTEAFTTFLFEQEWMVQKYNVHNTSLGYALQKLSHNFENLYEGNAAISNELFYAVAECIVNDQSDIFQRFCHLKSVKQETNGRQFNFVYEAKNYIDSYFLEKINLETLALEAKLSEYHFLRLFKTVFSITPYQYILKKRLEHSKLLLQQGFAIQEIALLTSFADSAAYCKAFKATYGCSPKQFANRN